MTGYGIKKYLPLLNSGDIRFKDIPEKVRYEILVEGLLHQKIDIEFKSLDDKKKHITFVIKRFAQRFGFRDFYVEMSFPDEKSSAYSYFGSKNFMEEHETKNELIEMLQISNRQQEEKIEHLTRLVELYKNRGNNKNIDDGAFDIYLEELEIKKADYSLDELKKAYKSKISQFHPDKFARESPDVNFMANKITQFINKAYKALSAHARL